MKKKRTCTTLSILLLTLALLLSSCQGAAEPVETGETTSQVTQAPKRTLPLGSPPTDKNEFVPSSTRLEKIYHLWEKDRIYYKYAAEVVMQPYCSDKQYSADDFADIQCTEIWPERIVSIEGVQCKSVVAFFENPTQSNEYLISVFEALEQREDVYMVLPASVYEACKSPVDPLYEAGFQWAIDQISLPDAWDITTGSSTVYVGVIDSGIDTTNPDLQVRVNTSLSKSFVTSDTDPFTDLTGHGTGVAGIIGAKGNNTTGITGVCWNVQLVSLKVTNTESADPALIAEAIEYAQQEGIDILNISYGSYSYNEDIQTEISEFNGLVVCGAGNDGKNTDLYPCYPASLNNSNIISVGASNESDNGGTWYNSVKKVNEGTNYGLTTVDLFAPGVDIYTTAGSGIGKGTGTSFAAPFVTGVAALLLSEYPDLSAVQLKRLIMENVDMISGLNGICVSGGRLNAYESMALVCEVADIYHTYSYTDCEDGVSHSVVCTECGYSNVSNHVCTSFLPHPRLQKHTGTCELCGAIYSEPHNWVYQVAGNRYECTGCHAITTSSPGTILKDPNENEME